EAGNGKAGKRLPGRLGLRERGPQEVRTFSYLLHPPLLDQMGLESSVKSYVEGFARRSGIQVVLEMSCGARRFPQEMELALFRVVQEGLGNIHRHAAS